jgi:hypothetical protein
MRSVFVCLVYIIIFSACTNLQLRLPNPRVETPEIIAEAERNRWAMGYDVGGANTIQPTSDASARPPDLTRPSSMAGFEPQYVNHYGFAQNFQLNKNNALSKSISHSCRILIASVAICFDSHSTL